MYGVGKEKRAAPSYLIMLSSMMPGYVLIIVVDRAAPTTGPKLVSFMACFTFRKMTKNSLTIEARLLLVSGPFLCVFRAQMDASLADVFWQGGGPVGLVLGPCGGTGTWIGGGKYMQYLAIIRVF